MRIQIIITLFSEIYMYKYTKISINILFKSNV